MQDKDETLNKQYNITVSIVLDKCKNIEKNNKKVEENKKDSFVRDFKY